MRANAIGHVRELVARANVASREDARVARAQMIVYEDALFWIVLDVRGFEVEAVHVRHAAGADEDFVHHDLVRCFAARGMQDLLAAAQFDALHFATQEQADTVLAKRRVQALDGRRLLFGSNRG